MPKASIASKNRRQAARSALANHCRAADLRERAAGMRVDGHRSTYELFYGTMRKGVEPGAEPRPGGSANAFAGFGD